MLLSSQSYELDPESGKNLSRMLDPGVKKAQDPRSGFATLFRSYAFFPLRGEV
jgi:hypothetical protein